MEKRKRNTPPQAWERFNMPEDAKDDWLATLEREAERIGAAGRPFWKHKVLDLALAALAKDDSADGYWADEYTLEKGEAA